MRILDLTLKDLRQIFGDYRSLLFLVAMPIVMTIFMGFAYRGGGETELTDDRLALGWVNQDPEGALSGQLQAMLANSEAVRLVELQPEAVDEAVRQGKVAGALVVPERFSALARQGPAQLRLVADPASSNGQSLLQLLRAPVMQLMSSVEIARLSAEAVGRPEDESEWNQALQAAAQAWSEAASAAWVRLELAVRQPEVKWYGSSPYNQASPGILVQFAIFGLVTSGQILVQERKTRTLQRMRTTSMRAWEIVAGHTLAMFAVVFMQEALLVVFGQLALGVDYAREPLGTLLISVALGLWIAALGLLIGVLVKSDDQVVLVALMAMFFFSALGGTWFPLETASGAFAAVSRLMPSTWAMTGYQNILLRGLGLESAWLPTAVLLAYALGFFGLAVWRFRKLEA